MLLHNKVREMKGGEILLVLATDPSTERDIPKFCAFLGYTLVESKKESRQFLYWIQKQAG